jgi:CheY-like chemotaxis protein
MVCADRGQLEQVILNLALNGRDAMPGGGTLTLDMTEVELDVAYSEMHLGVVPGPYVRLTVSDTGAGMTPQVRARIFEPFFTTKGVGQGTGLGLATVHGIVTRNGGSVTVSSEIGRGTTFNVYFPAAHIAEVPATPASAPLRLPVGTETIVVVEDDAALRQLTTRLLHKQGYRVLVAANADEALQLFDHTPCVDLLLTDVIMPQVSGPELARRLTAERPDLKVIFMSGYTEHGIVDNGILNPGISFLSKPFTIETLGRKIRELLDR